VDHDVGGPAVGQGGADGRPPAELAAGEPLRAERGARPVGGCQAGAPVAPDDAGRRRRRGAADYHDLGGDYFDRRDQDALERRLVRRLEALGNKVSLEKVERVA
jgi:hypothetical protein